MKQKVMSEVAGCLGSILGGLLVFLCAYLFFHFETWTERIGYIALTLGAVWVICRLFPDRDA